MAKRGRKPVIGGMSNISLRTLTKDALDEIKEKPNEPYWHVIERLISLWKYNKRKSISVIRDKMVLDKVGKFVIAIEDIMDGKKDE
jgi:hypothetical protein